MPTRTSRPGDALAARSTKADCARAASADAQQKTTASQQPVILRLGNIKHDLSGTPALPQALACAHCKPNSVCGIIHKGSHIEIHSWRYTVGDAQLATNLSIDPDLIERALEISGERTKKAAVTRALEEFIARRRQKRLLELMGKLEWNSSYNYKS